MDRHSPTASAFIGTYAKKQASSHLRLAKESDEREVLKLPVVAGSCDNLGRFPQKWHRKFI
jgi:hypothetical protein